MAMSMVRWLECREQKRTYLHNSSLRVCLEYISSVAEAAAAAKKNNNDTAYVLSHSDISAYEKPAVLPRVHLFLGLRASSLQRIFTFSFSIRHYICTHTPYAHIVATHQTKCHTFIYFHREKKTYTHENRTGATFKVFAMEQKKQQQKNAATLSTSQVWITKRTMLHICVNIKCSPSNWIGIWCVWFIFLCFVCENDTPHACIYSSLNVFGLFKTHATVYDWNDKAKPPSNQPFFSRSLRLFDLSLSYAYICM